MHLRCVLDDGMVLTYTIGVLNSSRARAMSDQVNCCGGVPFNDVANGLRRVIPTVNVLYMMCHRHMHVPTVSNAILIG